MKKKVNVLTIVLFSVFTTISQAQKNPLKIADHTGYETKVISAPNAPSGIVRTIKQDKKGSIWIASWQGVIKYDGNAFLNITNKVSTARFFYVLEDRKGNFWFASVGSGVYYYDGKAFQNFTTKNGLASNRVTHIYEDKAGNIWFGTEGGASRYDGKYFKNFKMSSAGLPSTADSVHVSAYQQTIPANSWMHNDVDAIIEDNSGKFWFATRGHTFTYDGKTISLVTNDGKPFVNVRSLIKDRKGNIWLGGKDGLWRYDGNTFFNYAQKFVGYIMEDKQGNIWTSAESTNDPGKVLLGYKSNNAVAWALSRYDANTLYTKEPTVTEIAHKPMIFGILEDKKGNIWFGDFNGVHRYDGKTITDFKDQAAKK